MKTFLHITGLVILAFSLLHSPAVVAQYKPLSPTFGTDIEINYYPFTYPFTETKKICVADNGYIFVLEKRADPQYKGWWIWESKNEGLTFLPDLEDIYSSSVCGLWDVDFVVTGENYSNIKYWVVKFYNDHVTGNSSIRVQWSNIGYLHTVFYKEWGTSSADTLYNVSIATDYRSPGYGSAPFSIAIAYTGHLGDIDYLNYAYSMDGGVTWTDSPHLYGQFGTNVLGRVSLSLGATTTYNMGYYAVAFECNKNGDLGDIGVMMDYIDNLGNWTMPVLVNQKMPPVTGKACRPSIMLMDNVLANPANPIVFPMVVAYEDRGTSPDEVNITYNTLLDSYTVGTQATLDDFSANWIDGPNGDLENEYSPDLSFDKTYNNFLLTYCNTDFNRLVYAYASMDGIHSNEWNFIDNYRDSSYPFEWNVVPHVDINPVKASACFAWTEKDPDDGQYSCYFDSEWSTIGVGVDEPAAASVSFSLYPNPAHEKVIVNITKSGSYDVTVLNLTGSQLLKQTFNERINTLNLEGLNAGVYFVRVSGGGLDSTEKLIVK